MNSPHYNCWCKDTNYLKNFQTIKQLFVYQMTQKSENTIFNGIWIKLGFVTLLLIGIFWLNPYSDGI